MDLTEKRKRRKKPYNSITYTTGDPAYNIAQFNKRMGTGDGTLPRSGLHGEDELNKAAEKAAKEAGTICAQSPDGGNTTDIYGGFLGGGAGGSLGGESAGEGGGASAGGEGGGMGESYKKHSLNESVSYVELTQEMIDKALANLFSACF